MSKKLIIIDIDETLLYASEKPLDQEPDVSLPPYTIYYRPHLQEFLTCCFSFFQVAIWSIGSFDYVQAVVNTIIPHPEQLAFAWSRERCTQSYNEETQSHYYIKDLNKVKRKGYQLDSVIVIDDTPERYVRQYGNLITVTPFYGDPADEELLYLQHYLLYLRDVANVRAVEKRGWRSWAKRHVSDSSVE